MFSIKYSRITNTPGSRWSEMIGGGEAQKYSKQKQDSHASSSGRWELLELNQKVAIRKNWPS